MDEDGTNWFVGNGNIPNFHTQAIPANQVLTIIGKRSGGDTGDCIQEQVSLLVVGRG